MAEPTLRTSLSKALRLSASFPLGLLALQIPEMTIHIAADSLPKNAPQEILLAIGLIFPYFCVMSFLSACATVMAVDQIQNSGKLSLAEIVQGVLSRLGRILPISIVVGLVTLLGIALAVVPGLYFMTAYLFVPALIVTNERLPWSVYLFRSKTLAKHRFWSVLALMLSILLAGIVVDILPGELSVSGTGLPMMYALKLLVSAIVSGLGNVWGSVYFFEASTAQKEKKLATTNQTKPVSC